MSTDGKKAVCIDKANKKAILAYIYQSDRHRNKFRHIVELLLGGHKNTELYDKEDISGKAKHVTAMKFFKGQENDRIYCKEQKTADGLFMIVAAVIYEKKKTNKVSKKEIPIIEKIATYDYEIESPRN
jgi:hypothetical protein